MKRIIRLTESDLTRIVRRVISEQEKKPMIDGASAEVGGNVLIVLSEPTTIAGSGYKGTPSVQVKFEGIEAKRDGTIVRKGNLVGYAICGKVANSDGGGGSMNYAPSNLSLRGSADVAEGGNLYGFKNNGPVGIAARNFCASKGAKNVGPGSSGDMAATAREVYQNIM
jgi:hypothetical protein